MQMLQYIKHYYCPTLRYKVTELLRSDVLLSQA